MENQVKAEDVDAVINWAAEVANKSGKSITYIVSRFASANKRLKDVEKAKVEVANAVINKK